MEEKNIAFEVLKDYINPEDLIRKYNAAVTERAPWNATWSVIQKQIFPDYRDYTGEPLSKTQPAKSNIRNQASIIVGLINGVVSELNSKICDPSVKWMDLDFGITDFRDKEPAKIWLYKCQEVLYDLFADPSSGFYSSAFSFHLDWFVLGTACREIVLRKDNGRIKFNTISMQDIFAELSGYGDIETIYRRFNLTAKQAIELFGTNLHHSILEAATSKNAGSQRTTKFEFFETVMPNPLKGQFPTMDYLSCIIDKKNKQLVDIELHACSPYIVSRYMVTPGETYGRSLVWYAMSNIAAVNRIMKRVLQIVDYLSMPPILTQIGKSLPSFQITPGAFIPGLDESGRPTYQPLQLVGDISSAIEMYNILVEELKRCILADNTYPYTNDQKTATEINSINIQMANRMRPPIVLLENEELQKTVLRTLTLLNQMGKLEPFPYEKLEIDPMELPDPISNLRVRFSGQMFNMQRLQDIQNSDSMLEKVVQMANINPQVLDRVNLDAYAKQLAEIYRVSPRILNDDKSVTEAREERAKQQQQQAQAEQQANLMNSLVKAKEAGLINEQST